MGKKGFSIADFFQSKLHINNILLLEGLAVGLLAGLVACLYRFLLAYGEQLCFNIALYVQTNYMYIIVLFAFLMILGIIISRFLQYEPYISGSGIPQVEAEMIDKIDEKWYRVIIAKIIAGTLSIIGGLSLGREGPSIQSGTMALAPQVGYVHRCYVWRRYRSGSITTQRQEFRHCYGYFRGYEEIWRNIHRFSHLSQEQQGSILHFAAYLRRTAVNIYANLTWEERVRSWVLPLEEAVEFVCAVGSQGEERETSGGSCGSRCGGRPPGRDSCARPGRKWSGYRRKTRSRPGASRPWRSGPGPCPGRG